MLEKGKVKRRLCAPVETFDAALITHNRENRPAPPLEIDNAYVIEIPIAG
jgi:hypothetical protein